MPVFDKEEINAEEIFNQSGYSKTDYGVSIDKNGRIAVISKKTGRKTIIGVTLPDGGVYITKKATKSEYQYDRKCINFYVDAETYQQIVQKAILSGKNLSQFCRDAVLAAADKVSLP